LKNQSWHAKIRVQSRGPAYSVDAVRSEYERAYVAVKKSLEQGGSRPKSC
jgi:hypothetical protein